jgi:hypothetical protein
MQLFQLYHRCRIVVDNSTFETKIEAASIAQEGDFDLYTNAMAATLQRSEAHNHRYHHNCYHRHLFYFLCYLHQHRCNRIHRYRCLFRSPVITCTS